LTFSFFLLIYTVEKFDPVKQMRTHPLLINRRSNRLTIEQLKSTKINCDEEQMNVKFRIFLIKIELIFLAISKNAKEKIYSITKTN
jgi:hypothetical protein